MKNKGRKSIRIVYTAFLLFFSISFQVTANDINLGLFLNKQTHVLGEAAPIMSITAQNPDGAVVQDVHIGVISPDGTIYEFPDWNNNLQPWLASFTVPASLQFPHTEIINLSSFNGELTPGIWKAYFALTNPGTIEITQLQLIDLNIVENTGSGGAAAGGSRYGSVNINRIESSFGTNVSASAGFFEANTSFPELIGHLEGRPPVIDQCSFNEIPTDPTTGVTDFEIFSLDAGQISVNGATGKNTLQKTSVQSNIAYSSEPSLPFFDNAEVFTFMGTGGPGVGAFNIVIPSTKALQLIAPAAGGSFSINPNQPLVLRWSNNNNGSGEINASLVVIDTNFNDPTDSSVYSITCRFIDDGEGVIPANLISQLASVTPDSGSGFPIDIPGGLPIDIPGFGGSVSLSVSRINYRFFTTGAPVLSNGFATVSSSVSLTGDFQ